MATDGVVRASCRPASLLKLDPGESVTLLPGNWHAFWGEGGDVLIGEVSTVNNDLTDNIFAEPIGRFAEIEEDEEPLHLLVSDYDRAGLRAGVETNWPAGNLPSGERSPAREPGQVQLSDTSVSGRSSPRDTSPCHLPDAIFVFDAFGLAGDLLLGGGRARRLDGFGVSSRRFPRRSFPPCRPSLRHARRHHRRHGSWLSPLGLLLQTNWPWPGSRPRTSQSGSPFLRIGAPPKSLFFPQFRRENRLPLLLELL